MNELRLYDYQEEMTARIADAFSRHRSVMVQMPTGTGKTVVLAAYLLRRVGGRVLIVAHRRELVQQIRQTIERLLPRSGHRDDDRRIAVCSVQWLTRHYAAVGTSPELVVVDEAHHAPARIYAEMWRRFPGARFLGMTATPCRLGRGGLSELFDVLLSSPPVADFIRRGRLARFDFFTIRPDSRQQALVDKLKKRGADGDYQPKEMDALLNKRPGIERLFESLTTCAAGRRGIVYAFSVPHARAIAEYYTEKGLCAAAIDGTTPPDVRTRLTGDFKAGRLDVLVNVDIFSEGFDCPETGFIQLARPTLSLARYLQMVGRGLRTANGKQRCVIVDNVGLYRAFGLPTRAWDWELLFRGDRRCLSSPVPFATSERNEAGNAGRDSEMVCIALGENLLETAEREMLPEKSAQRSLPLHAFASADGRKWGVKRGAEVILEAVFRKIAKIRSGFILAENADGSKAVFDENGSEVVAFPADDAVTLCADGLVHAVSPEAFYLDLRTLCRIGRREASRRPSVVRYGRIEFLKTDHNYILREGRGRTFPNFTTAPTFDRRGTFLLVSELMSTAETAMLLPPGLRGVSVATFRWCIFDEHPSELYLVYAELTAGRLVVFREGIYCLVEADGKRSVVADNAQPDCAERLERLVRREQEECRKRVVASLPEFISPRSV